MFFIASKSGRKGMWSGCFCGERVKYVVRMCFSEFYFVTLHHKLYIVD